ncbi:phosphotransferase [Tenacibaculum amylolyticum]|uniref:phosphotransferase n=1 Tax=Tenacibaculum amylolyticum TaxID=104269 RepID=UPI0038937E69
MSLYTHLSIQDIENILSTFYTIQNVQEVILLKGGSENTNYLVKTQEFSFVLTLCEQKTVAEAERLASLLQYLNDNDFKTSEVIHTSQGDLITTFKNKPIILKSFIEGIITEDLSNDQLEELGKKLAHLHQIKAPDYITDTLNFGVKYFDKVKVYAAGSDFDKWLTQIKLDVSKTFSDKLPKALIHSDIFSSNIIVNTAANSTTIMDFEEACYYYRVFDIGMMIVGTCSANNEISLSKATHILKGYQKITPLLTIEKEALQMSIVYAAAATSYWRHQNFNYVKPNPKRKDDYIEMQRLADFARAIPKDVFNTIFN